MNIGMFVWTVGDLMGALVIGLFLIGFIILAIGGAIEHCYRTIRMKLVNRFKHGAPEPIPVREEKGVCEVLSVSTEIPACDLVKINIHNPFGNNRIISERRKALADLILHDARSFITTDTREDIAGNLIITSRLAVIKCGYKTPEKK